MAPRKMRAPAVEFKLMSCGKHKRAKHTLQDSTYGFSGRKPKEVYKRAVRPNELLGSCICDYEDYPTLREERTSLGEEFKNITKPFKFLALPGEVRNTIYEKLFILNQAIEFCPENFPYDGGNNTCPTYTPDWHKHYTITISDHYYTFGQENLNPVAKFLRVNKQICKEATPYLYSCNEFRFTNCTGWIALDFFLHRVGPKKSAMLENVSVCHPDFLVKPKSITASSSFAEGSVRGDYIGQRRWGDGHGNEGGFYYDKRWFQPQFPLTKDPTLVFDKAGKLRRLRLIVPPVKLLGDPLRPIVNPDRFENLTVAVVKLRTAEEAEHEQTTPEESARNAQEGLAEMLEALGKNVRVEVYDVDELGRYPLMAGLQESSKGDDVPGDVREKAEQNREQGEMDKNGEQNGDLEGSDDETEQETVDGADGPTITEEASEQQD